MPQLAQMVGFSRFHLTRRFHHATGETLEGFLRRVRLERAAFELRAGASVLSVATRNLAFTDSEQVAEAIASSTVSPAAVVRGKRRASVFIQLPAQMVKNLTSSRRSCARPRISDHCSAMALGTP